MSAPEKPIVNMADVPLREFGKGDKFAAKLGRIGPMLGSTGLGCTLTVVSPGKRAFPFHRHHVIHEMFLVLDGAGEIRRFVNVYVNEEDVRFLDGLRTALKGNDQVAIVPAIAGGGLASRFAGPTTR